MSSVLCVSQDDPFLFSQSPPLALRAWGASLGGPGAQRPLKFHISEATRVLGSSSEKVLASLKHTSYK